MNNKTKSNNLDNPIKICPQIHLLTKVTSINVIYGVFKKVSSH